MKYIEIAGLALILFSFSARAETLAKVTVTFHNNEEKIFKFSESEGTKPLDLNSKWNQCGINFKHIDGGEKLGQFVTVTLMCSPTANKNGMKDRFRLYETTAVCPSVLPSVFTIEDFSQTAKSGKEWAQTANSYKIILECQ